MHPMRDRDLHVGLWRGFVWVGGLPFPELEQGTVVSQHVLHLAGEQIMVCVWVLD